MHEKSIINIKNQAERHLKRIDEILAELDDLGSGYVFGQEGVKLSDLDDLYAEMKTKLKKLRELKKFTD